MTTSSFPDCVFTLSRVSSLSRFQTILEPFNFIFPSIFNEGTLKSFPLYPPLMGSDALLFTKSEILIIDPSSSAILVLPDKHFPVPGSPTNNICKSPLVLVPSSFIFLTPPNNCNIIASLISKCP